MRISFFEEFPTAKSLQKIKLISWPSKLYLAAPSLKEFNRIKAKIRSRKIIEIVYWPILKKREGYWISPFSKQMALRHLFDELRHQKIPVMLDLELPTTRNPWLYLTELFHFRKDKKLIHSFICSYPGEISLCEYSAPEKSLQRLGLHYANTKSKVMKMIYHSVHSYSDGKIRSELQRGVTKFGGKYIVGFGTIAVGVGGNEPILSPEQLEKDLRSAKEVGVKEVVLFRLGGLNKKYVKVLEKFV